MIIKNKKWKNLNLLIIAFTLVILTFEVLPRVWDIGKLVTELISNSNKLERLDEIDNNLLDLNIENKNLKRQLGEIVSDYKSDKNISTTMRYLNEIANKSKLKITSIKPVKLKNNDKLWLQAIELKFYSNYERLYNFVRFLEHSPKVILLKEIKVKPKVKSRDKLEIVVNIDVYLNL